MQGGARSRADGQAAEQVEDQLAAWAAMFRANALFSARLDEALRATAGMSLVEHELLAVLAHHGGRMRMGDLARELLFSKSGITRLVAKLEDQHGWVERVFSKADRRATWAELTPAGRRAVTASERVFETTVAELFAGHLAPAELRRLTRGLEHLVSANDCAAPEGSCAEDLGPGGPHPRRGRVARHTGGAAGRD